jgi:transposase
LATNELDETKLSDDQFFTHYTQDQQKVEGGFRFMKDPMFMANTLFLKSPKRIEVLMAIMTLCLLVYSALEYRIRQSLLENKATFPNQIGGSTDKPDIPHPSKAICDLKFRHSKFSKNVVFNV